MADSKTTIFNEFTKIQELQQLFDRKKAEGRKIQSEIRSLAQRIPQLIRELNLR